MKPANIPPLSASVESLQQGETLRLEENSPNNANGGDVSGADLPSAPPLPSPVDLARNRTPPPFLKPMPQSADNSTPLTVAGNTAPSRPSEASLATLSLPDGVPRPTLVQVDAWIAGMSAPSAAQIKERRSFGAGLFRHKPTSVQYRYAKQMMDATARTQFTAVLKQQIAAMTVEGADSRDVMKYVDMYLSVQYARIRIHDPRETQAYRREHVKNGMVATAIAISTGWMTGASIVGAAVHGIVNAQAIHRDYYRSENRPEYADAFNDMMAMLRAPEADVSTEAKQEIVATILDRFIREEKLLTPLDANRILFATDERTISSPPSLDRLNERRLGGTLLSSPSTPEQRRNVIAWANSQGERANHLSSIQFQAHRRAGVDRLGEVMVRQLDVNLARAYEAINALRRTKKDLEKLTVPADLKIYNDLPNAGAFSRLLERAEGDASNKAKGRADELYKNVETILVAIMESKEFAQQIFNESVGGTKHCINNALEKISELAIKSVNRVVVKNIEEGKLTLPQFVAHCRANFSLGTLQNGIESEVIPFLSGRPLDEPALRETFKEELGNGQTLEVVIARHFPIRAALNTKLSQYSKTGVKDLKEAYEPEVAQSLKWSLKEPLKLPDTVTPSRVVYPKKTEVIGTENEPKRLHQVLVDVLKAHVKKIVSDPVKRHAYLMADPLWREGITAFARKMNQEQDVEQLDNYKLAKLRDSLMEYGGNIIDMEGRTVTDQGLRAAFQALTDLGELYVPKTGQNRIWSKGGNSKKDKYKTNDPAHQALYDDIEQTNREFESALRDIENRWALYATPSLLGTPPSLPADGNFKASFRLPDGWSEKMEDLKRRSQAAEIKEVTAMNVEREQTTIPQLEREIEDAMAVDQPGQTKEQLAQIKDVMIAHYSEGANRLVRPFSLDDYKMPQFDENGVPVMDIETETQVLSPPPYLMDLRARVATLANEKAALRNATAYLTELQNPIGDVPPVPPLHPVNWEETPRPFPGSSAAGSSTAQTISLDPSATSAAAILDSAPNLMALSDVEDRTAELANNQMFDTLREASGSALRMFEDEFDAETGAPTEAYQDAMATYVDAALLRLAGLGLDTGDASFSGYNCLIHSVLDQLGIRGANNVTIAAGIRQQLVDRLAGVGIRLGREEFLDSFGPHAAHLMDIINENYRDADIAMRIYQPMPNGGLHFINQGNEGGTAGAQRGNAVAVMWVGNHYEPIKVQKGV